MYISNVFPGDALDQFGEKFARLTPLQRRQVLARPDTWEWEATYCGIAPSEDKVVEPVVARPRVYIAL